MKKQVFVIHGWTYSLDKWADVTAALKKRGIDVVLLKVPGLTSPSTKTWDIAGYVDWLNKQLKHTEKPIVIGHSNGGRIALAFTQKFPDKIHKLILIDSAGVAHNKLVPRAKLKVLRGVSKAGKALSRVPPVKKAFYKIIGAQDYLNAPPNMKRTMQNMLQADQTMNFQAVRVPTTIIWGRDDAITPIKDGRKLEKSIANAKLFTVDNARHAPFFSHPDEVADLIINVLAEET